MLVIVKFLKKEYLLDITGFDEKLFEKEENMARYRKKATKEYAITG